jgi:ABC-2 type transport system ATP-binding protein
LIDYFAHAYKMAEGEIAGRITEVISQTGLDVKRDALIRGLSRGMKQRLGIARAIIHRPKVLLLDEPAPGLDPKARFDLRNLLRALRDQGTPILISSHILPELEDFCTSIGIMEKGHLVRSGASKKLPHWILGARFTSVGSAGPSARFVRSWKATLASRIFNATPTKDHFSSLAATPN